MIQRRHFMQIIVILLKPDKLENPDVLSLKTILKSEVSELLEDCDNFELRFLVELLKSAKEIFRNDQKARKRLEQ